jgi:hypothetical protein
MFFGKDHYLFCCLILFLGMTEKVLSKRRHSVEKGETSAGRIEVKIFCDLLTI